MAHVEANITLRLDDWPEALVALRRELASVLREEADGEPEHVAKKLVEIAARFEVGIDVRGGG